jgi:hypothetical protein
MKTQNKVVESQDKVFYIKVNIEVFFFAFFCVTVFVSGLNINPFVCLNDCNATQNF